MRVFSRSTSTPGFGLEIGEQGELALQLFQNVRADVATGADREDVDEAAHAARAAAPLGCPSRCVVEGLAVEKIQA